MYMDLLDGNRRLTTRGVVNKPDIRKDIECYVNTNFSGGWDQTDANDSEKVMLRTRYLITYAVCPVLWCSKLQT